MDKSETNTSSNPPSNQAEPKPEKLPLWGEIVKGWYWVVFSWKMLQRMGGMGAIARSLSSTVVLLLKRTFVQLNHKK
jgi:hypothetical protein